MERFNFSMFMRDDGITLNNRVIKFPSMTGSNSVKERSVPVSFFKPSILDLQ